MMTVDKYTKEDVVDKHYYYLHTNGDLIHKSAFVVDSDPQYFDSDFVKKVWTINTEDRGTLWILLTEALAMGARKDRIKELQEKWGATNEDAQVFAERAGLVLKMDGNQWCAHFSDFENLQESQAGFGDDCLEALADLAKQGQLA